MPKSRIPSPVRSLGSITPRRHTRSHLSKSVGSSPGPNASKLTVVENLKGEHRASFVPSPLGNSVLTDKTDIEEPRRENWWKNIDKSRDIMDVLDERPVEPNNIVEELDVELLSQENKDEYLMDIPDSSGSESIASIIVPQRKLFTQKENQPQNKYGQVIGTRDSMAKDKTRTEDKPVDVGTKSLFGQGVKRSKPVFPSALLNISADKTLIGNKTNELAVDRLVPPPRNLFGNRAGTKRKNMFTDFIVSESEDEIPDIQTRRFTFTKQPEPLPRISSISRGRDTSPTSSVTTDIELDDWKHLPSSTMMEYQLEDAQTPARRARLSKLLETRETINSNSTADKTKQSEKSVSSKDKSFASAKDNDTYIEEKALSPPKNFDRAKNTSLARTKNAGLEEPTKDKDDVEANDAKTSVVETKKDSRAVSLFDDPGTDNVETNKIDNLTKTLNKTDFESNKIDNLTRTLNKTNKQLSKSNIEDKMDDDASKIDNLTRTLNKSNKNISKSKIDEAAIVELEQVDNLTHTLNKSNKILSKSHIDATNKQDNIEKDKNIEANKIDNLTHTLNNTNDKQFSVINEEATDEAENLENLTCTLNKSNKILSKSHIDATNKQDNIEKDKNIEANKIDNLTRTLNKTNNKQFSVINEEATDEAEILENLTCTLNKSNKILSKSNSNTTGTKDKMHSINKSNKILSTSNIEASNKQDDLEFQLASIVGNDNEDQESDENINLTYEEDDPEKDLNQNNEQDVATNVSANSTSENKTAQIKEKTLVIDTPMPRKSKSVMSKVVNETFETGSTEDQLDILPDDIDEDAVFKPSQELERSTEIKTNKEISQENKNDSDVNDSQNVVQTVPQQILHESKEIAKDEEEVELEIDQQEESKNEIEFEEQESDVVNESEPLTDEEEDEQNNSQEQEETDKSNDEILDESEGAVDASQEIDDEEQNESQEIDNVNQDEGQQMETEEQNEESNEEINISQENDEDISREISNNDVSQGIEEGNGYESQEIEDKEQDTSHEIENDENNESNENKEQDDSEIENDENNESNENEEQDESEIENESQEIIEQNTNQEDITEDQVENNTDQEVDSDIPDTPNASHDTTGRYRKKDKPQSPEAVLHTSDVGMNSFVGSKGRNTSIRKTILKKNFSVRQSIAPPRVSSDGGTSDGTKNSSVEGSGWDSHRNERKTLRLTLGKDFSPRKSLRTLVIEKSARRQTVIDDANTKLHQANSTELPFEAQDSDFVYEDAPETNENNISLQTRRAKLDDYWLQLKKDTIHEMAKIEDDLRQSLKKNLTKGDFLNSKIPSKLTICRQPLKLQTAPKAKSAKRTLASLENIPAELREDMKYKPPKRFRPSNAPWITNRLYNFLENKLKPKYDYKARVRAEKLVETIYAFASDLRRLRVANPGTVTDLKREMARLEIVKTHYEFYHFFNEFLPNEVRFKVVPDIVNRIPTPKNGVFSDILVSDGY